MNSTAISSYQNLPKYYEKTEVYVTPCVKRPGRVCY